MDVVVALEVHGDSLRPEVVVLSQVDDLANHLLLGRLWAEVRPPRAVTQTLDAKFLIALAPLIEASSADAVIAAGPGDATSHLLGVPDDC